MRQIQIPSICRHLGEIILSLSLALSLSLSTFISPEQTAGEVLQIGSLDEDAPRKVWRMNPDSQVLKVLQEAELQPLTLPLEDATICEEESSLCLQRENISGWWFLPFY